jgi:hypothetical protein
MLDEVITSPYDYLCKEVPLPEILLKPESVTPVELASAWAEIAPEHCHLPICREMQLAQNQHLQNCIKTHNFNSHKMNMYNSWEGAHRTVLTALTH